MKRLLLALAVIAAAATAHAVEDLNSLESLRAQAERGDAAAQLEMGILYEYGFNLPQNRPPALAWYMLSAQQGNERALKRRDLLRARMTSAEVDEAERLARELTVKRPATAPAEPLPGPSKPEPPAEPNAPAPAAPGS